MCLAIKHGEHRHGEKNVCIKADDYSKTKHFEWSKLRMKAPTHPLIIAKDSSLEKYELPGMAVTVSFPAFIRSGSTSFGVGNGPWSSRHMCE